MTLRSIVHRDLLIARRSQTFWSVTALLASVAGILVYIPPSLFDQSTAEHGLDLLTEGLGVVVPLVAIAATITSISGLRDGGRITLLLAQPVSRAEVFVGKYVSRLLVLSSATGLTFALVVVLLFSRYAEVPLDVLFGTFVVTLIYTTVFASIGVAISSMIDSQLRAVVGAIGTYFSLVVVYLLPSTRPSNAARFLHVDVFEMRPNPDLYNVIDYVSPYVAYKKCLNVVFPTRFENVFFLDSAQNIDASNRTPSQTPLDIQPELPLYLRDEFAVVVFLLWIGVTVAIGLYRFERIDLQ